jgi:hypothetical protein
MSTSESQQRVANFNVWQDHTDMVLALPNVQDRLGCLGAQLTVINETAFLPEVSWSSVSVPLEHQDTDSIAILPMRPEDNGSLVPDNSMLSPTRSGRQRVAEELRQAGKNVSAEDIELTIKGMAMRVGWQDRRESFSARRAATAVFWGFENDAFVASRPVVLVNAENFANDSPVLRGMAGAHELVHGIDYETVFGGEVIMSGYQATTEFRAYRAAYIIGECAIAAGKLTSKEFEAAEPMTSQMERVRQEYGFDSDALLSGQLQIDPNHPAVFDLMMRGTIPFA